MVTIKSYIKKKIIVVLLRIAQVITFLIPLGVMMLIYRDTFFTKKTGIGISGLAVMGVIVYILSIKQIIGKLPKILYFVFLFMLFFLMNYLGEFLFQIGCVMLIGAVLSLPLNPLIHVFEVDSETELKERSKMKVRKQMKDDTEVEVEING